MCHSQIPSSCRPCCLCSLVLMNKQSCRNDVITRRSTTLVTASTFPETTQNSSQKSITPPHSDSSDVATSTATTSSCRAAEPNPPGNFVNYLPQDEAVAVGLSAEDGGLDPGECWRVVDLLNRELSWLLKLNPRDFWREGVERYDFPYRGAKGVVTVVIVGELELMCDLITGPYFLLRTIEIVDQVGSAQTF